MVTASVDKTARLWAASSGGAIGQPMQHGAEVYSVAFSPDGQRVVTASGDKTARVWDVPKICEKGTSEDILLLADLAEASGGVALLTSGEGEILNLLTTEQVKATREKISAKFGSGVSVI